MNTSQRITVVHHIDLAKRPLENVRRELWNAAAGKIAQNIFEEKMSGKEAVPFIYDLWPQAAYAILVRSPSFDLTEEEFMRLSFGEQQNWTGPAYGLLRLMQTVEQKLIIANHLAEVSGSAGVIV